MRASRTRRLALSALGAVVLAIVVLVFVQSRYGIILGQTQSWAHHIQTVVPSAFEVTPGQRMVIGGTTAGEITKAEVTKTGQAHIVMGLDDRAWPIPTDSVLTLRMGGTIKYTDRFISIARGHAQSTVYENGNLPASHFIVPVEYSSLFNIFDRPTRAGLKSFFANGGPTFAAAAKPFHSALEVAPPTLAQAAAVFRDLSYDQRALSTLVSSTAEVSDAVARSNPGLRTLLDGAANTFGTVASQNRALAQVVETGATSLHTQGVLYYHLGRTLPKLAQLADRLRPGVAELSLLAGPLDSTLQELVNIEPTAVHTLQTVKDAGPSLDSLLTDARIKLMPPLTSVGNQTAKELDCIRPYTPEIINMLQGWGAWQKNGFTDPRVNISHFLVSLLPFPDSVPLNTQQLHQLLPSLDVNVPVMPGSSWNQPWPQPQCGITAAQTIAANDSENNTYNPNGSKMVPFASTTPTYR